MPDFNWPDTPTLNQEVTGPAGQLYKWDGVKWIGVAGGGGGGDGGPWAPLFNLPQAPRSHNYSPYDIDGQTY